MIRFASTSEEGIKVAGEPAGHRLRTAGRAKIDVWDKGPDVLMEETLACAAVFCGLTCG